MKKYIRIKRGGREYTVQESRISREALEDMLRDGLTQVQIGKACGLSRGRIQHMVKAFGIDYREIMQQRRKCSLNVYKNK